jgi:hypothetical protein
VPAPINSAIPPHYSHVTQIGVTPEHAGALTHIPGVITAGRFYSHGKWVFWDVHDPANAIGIELRNEHYSKLIVEVGNPEDQISQIRQATGQTLG